MKKTYIILLFGVLMGLVFTGAPGVIFISLLLIGILICLNHFVTNVSSKIFLKRIFLVGLILRIIFSTLNYYIPTLLESSPRTDSQPDAQASNENALYIARLLTRENYSRGMINHELPSVRKHVRAAFEQYNGKLPQYGEYQFGVFVWLIGILYSWLGYCPITAKILNSIIGSLTAIIAYFIARRLFKSETSARISATVIMFFPSTLFWSVTLLREPIINFLFLVYMLFLSVFLTEKKKYSLLILFILSLIISFFRSQLLPVFLTGLAFVVFLLFCKKVFSMKILTKTIIILFICMIGMTIMIRNYQVITTKLEKGINYTFHRHKASAISYSQATWYKIYPESFYAKTSLALRDWFNLPFVISVFKALAYYLFSPFPWDVQRAKLLPFTLQAIFTFICIPFIVKGILVSLRQNTLVVSSIVFLLSFFIFLNAMSEGIVGIVVRHRDMFTPFWIIFAAHGFCLLFMKNNLEFNK